MDHRTFHVSTQRACTRYIVGRRGVAVGLIREKVVEDMKLRASSEHTQKCYPQYEWLFAVHYRRLPTELGEGEVESS